jgi:hypothetical protein
MNLSLSPQTTDIPGAEALTNLLMTSINERHAENAFEDLTELSHWLHSAHRNPRVRYETNEEGTQLQVVNKLSRKTILTIHAA